MRSLIIPLMREKFLRLNNTKRPLTCGFVRKFDRCFTLRRRRGPKAARRQSLRGGLCLSLVLGLLLNSNMTITANAYSLTREQQDWALVAMNHLQGDLQETQCWVRVIWQESRFNPKARNGSHYGLAQMRNDIVRTLTPRQQVRMHMRYLDHRYNGSACKAEKHLINKGWH